MYASIAYLSHQAGKVVQIKGWVYSTRSSGQIGFLLLRDGTGICQCVIRKQHSAKNFEVFQHLKQESLVQVEGLVQERGGDFEIHIQKLQAFGESQPWPLGKKDHGIDFLLNHRHLWLRSKRPWAILKIRHTVTQAIHQFLDDRGFTHLSAPILTPNACEGAGSLFSVNFFQDEKIYLSQSGQLYMEAGAASLGKVYCVNPVFRAEKSSTRRHLLEFWMAEPEMAFCDLNSCMNLAEELVIHLVSTVLKKHIKELEILKRDCQGLKKIASPFPRLSYETARQILRKKKAQPAEPENSGLTGEEESLLSEDFEQPVFIHRYPLNTKAFYMKTDPKSPHLSLSFDLLGTEGYGELIGGSEREDNLKILEEKLARHQIEKKNSPVVFRSQTIRVFSPQWLWPGH